MTTLVPYTRHIVSQSGDVIPLTTAEVRLVSTGALASIFSDSAGLTPLSNPMTATAEGFVSFWVDAGRYTIEASNGVGTTTWTVDLAAASHDGDVRQDEAAVFQKAIEFQKRPTVLASSYLGEAYSPSVTTTTIIDAGYYTHVPSIAFKDDSNGAMVYLRNTTSTSESQTGQEMVFERTSDAAVTWTTAATELNSSSTANNPLDPTGDGNIQGESFILYDANRAKYITTNAHRANDATNRGFISIVDPGDPTVTKAQNYGYVWDSTTNAIELTTDVTGSAPSGKKFTRTIAGAESQVIPFKPVLAADGRIVVPLVFLEGAYGNLHRVGYAIHSASDLTVVSEGCILDIGETSALLWEPTLIEEANGNWYSIARNNSGTGDGETVVDNNMVQWAVTPDLLGASNVMHLDHDLHTNRHMMFKAREGLYVRIGSVHRDNRNAFDVAFAGGGAGPYGFGFTFSAETDAAEFAQYVDGVAQGGFFYALASFSNVGTDPRRVRLYKFALPTADRWQLSPSKKNVYEEDGGTNPSVSGTELTIPPQQLASLPSMGKCEVMAVCAKISALPASSQPYAVAVVGNEEDGHLHLELRLNAGADGVELWAAEKDTAGVLIKESKIRDVAGSLDYHTYTLSVDRVRGFAFFEGYGYPLGGMARAFVGDIHPDITTAHTGNIVLDASRSSVTVYGVDDFNRLYAPEYTPGRFGRTVFKEEPVFNADALIADVEPKLRLHETDSALADAKVLEVMRGDNAAIMRLAQTDGTLVQTLYKILCDNSGATQHEWSLANSSTRLVMNDDGLSIGEGRLTLFGNKIGGREITIADDDVESITPPRKGGFMAITCNGDGDFTQTASCAILLYDVGSSTFIEKMTGWATVGSGVDVTTSNVTGTTGSDGDITVAALSDVIKIENRDGGSREFQLTFF